MVRPHQRHGLAALRAETGGSVRLDRREHDPALRLDVKLDQAAAVEPGEHVGRQTTTTRRHRIRYERLDDSPEARRAVHYYIEDIDLFGKVTRHGPIVVQRGERRGALIRVTSR